MDFENLIPVTGQDGDGATTTAATNTDGTPVAGVSTPAQPDEETAKKITEYEAKIAKYDEDIRKLKSNSDKRLSQQEAEFNKRLKDYEEKMRKVQLSSMDEDTRKQYEGELQQNRLQELEEQNRKYQQMLEEREQRETAINFFLDAGLKKSDLTLDGDLNDLTASGWDALKRRTKELQDELDKLKSAKPEPKKPEADKHEDEIEAPETLNHNNGSISKGLTIQQAADKYAGGDVDALFKKLETGQLPQVVKALSER